MGPRTGDAMKHKGPRALPAPRYMQESRDFGVQVARAELNHWGLGFHDENFPCLINSKFGDMTQTIKSCWSPNLIHMFILQLNLCHDKIWTRRGK